MIGNEPATTTPKGKGKEQKKGKAIKGEQASSSSATDTKKRPAAASVQTDDQVDRAPEMEEMD